MWTKFTFFYPKMFMFLWLVIFFVAIESIHSSMVSCIIVDMFVVRYWFKLIICPVDDTQDYHSGFLGLQLGLEKLYQGVKIKLETTVTNDGGQIM